MEFWGVEMKNGEPLKVVLESDKVLHVSHVSLGENKKNKGSEPIYIYLKFNNQKFVISTLSHEKFPQTTLDLVLEKDFELSHSWKNGSVYCAGYQIDCEESDKEDEDHQMSLDVNPKKAVADGEKAGAKEGTVKSDTAVKQVNFKEPIKAKSKQEEDSSDEDEEEDEEEDVSSDDESSDDKAPIANGGDDSDGSSDDDDSESSDYETPTKKPASSKKRPVEPEVKTPVDNKKAKLSTPQKTEKKVSGHVATPYPSKQAGKKPTSSEPKTQSPKAAGTHLCKACSRTFTTDIGLQSHTKAKHSAAA